MGVATLTPLGKEIKKRLIDADHDQNWLIEQVSHLTGLYFDRSYLHKIMTGKLNTPGIVNVMVFTEGTDIPLVESVIIARPTKSDSLYSQMVGRGLRLHPDKERLILIDCVGITGKANLCTAPSLLGIDLSDIPAKQQQQIQGPIFELPERAVMAADCPESWIKNVKIVDLWAKEMQYNTHNVNYFKMPDGSLVCCLPKGKKIVIPCPDSLGRVRLGGEMIPYQQALDRAYLALCANYPDERKLWDLEIAKRWGSKPATENQIAQIQRRKIDVDTGTLTRLQATHILNRIFNGKKVHR